MGVMDDVLRCVWCKRVIGSYEPMILHVEGEARGASVLREGGEPVGDWYHRHCFQDAYGPKRKGLP